VGPEGRQFGVVERIRAPHVRLKKARVQSKKLDTTTREERNQSEQGRNLNLKRHRICGGWSQEGKRYPRIKRIGKSGCGLRNRGRRLQRPSSQKSGGAGSKLIRKKKASPGRKASASRAEDPSVGQSRAQKGKITEMDRGLAARK